MITKEQVKEFVEFVYGRIVTKVEPFTFTRNNNAGFDSLLLKDKLIFIGEVITEMEATDKALNANIDFNIWKLGGDERTAGNEMIFRIKREHKAGETLSQLAQGKQIKFNCFFQNIIPKTFANITSKFTFTGYRVTVE